MTQAQDLRRYDHWFCVLPLHLTTVPTVLSINLSINLTCCLLVFLVRGDIHCAGGVPAGVVFSPHC